LKNVEDEGTIWHWLIEITKGVDHALHLEVARDEGTERVVEVESMGLMVTEEPLLDGNPSLTSCATVLTNGILELDSEHVEQLEEDDVVHPPQAGERGGNDDGSDVVVEGISLQCQQDEVALASVVVGEGVKDDGDQGPDVLDADGLGMEVGDCVNFVHVIGVGEEGRVCRSGELLLDDGKVALDGICSALLLLPHEVSGMQWVAANRAEWVMAVVPVRPIRPVVTEGDGGVRRRLGAACGCIGGSGHMHNSGFCTGGSVYLHREGRGRSGVAGCEGGRAAASCSGRGCCSDSNSHGEGRGRSGAARRKGGGRTDSGRGGSGKLERDIGLGLD
jgi:hypothetical protein